MKQIVSVAVVLAAGCFTVGRAWAGSLDALAAPTSSNSAMYRLEDIYRKLDTQGTNVAMRTGGFTLPAGGPTNGTMHTLNDIMALVTNRAPVAKTQQGSYLTGDDGTYQKGVAWPNPRFTVQANTNCVVDNLTGLMWARNANMASNLSYGVTNNGLVTFGDAFNVITAFNGIAYGGYTDWRLPNTWELMSLVHFGVDSPALPNTSGTGRLTENAPFSQLQQSPYYASSTTTTSDTNKCFSVIYSIGAMTADSKANPMFVWPVRYGP